jgi:hypothetical protein
MNCKIKLLYFGIQSRLSRPYVCSLKHYEWFDHYDVLYHGSEYCDPDSSKLLVDFTIQKK